MDIQKELLRYQREIALALKEQETADKEAAVAGDYYTKALAEWEAKNPAIVAKKNRTAQAKSDAKKRVESLREEAKKLLGDHFIENLPEGFNQKREKVVKIDSQGFLQQARENFPFLLKVDIEAAEKFFKAMAVEQEDGAFIIPEHIRRWANVEVVVNPKPEISDAKLSKLVFEQEDTEPLSVVAKAAEVVDTAWTPPANAIAILTAPETELPIIEDFSSEGESLPISEAINPDAWDEEAAELQPVAAPLSKYGYVPPTDEIDF